MSSQLPRLDFVVERWPAEVDLKEGDLLKGGEEFNEIWGSQLLKGFAGEDKDLKLS